MKEQYKTIAREASAEIVEKKSRFIASIKYVEHEEDAILFIEQIKKKFWDARHNVFAYSIGIENPVMRFSDDGEPAGTAGMPILEVIKKSGIENVVIVVTRYFGGILLGTGGLVRAYSSCAKEGIEASGIEIRILSAKIQMKIDYQLLGKIQNMAANKGYKVCNVEYSDEIVIELAVPVTEIDNFETEVNEFSAGKIVLNEVERGYYKYS